jgi:hypothetical protein
MNEEKVKKALKNFRSKIEKEVDKNGYNLKYAFIMGRFDELKKELSQQSEDKND